MPHCAKGLAFARSEIVPAMVGGGGCGGDKGTFVPLSCPRSIEGVRCNIGVWGRGEEESFDLRLYISLPERRRYLYIFMTEWLGQGGGGGRSLIGLSQEGGGAGHGRGGCCGGGRGALIAILVLGLLRACGRGAESGEQGEKCVLVGGRLNEALVFDDGCQGACGVSSLVLILLVVGDCLAGRSFLFLSFWFA